MKDSANKRRHLKLVPPYQEPSIGPKIVKVRSINAESLERLTQAGFTIILI